MDFDDAADATLGGYLKRHDRPPAFEGSDGQPYTVSIEIEKTPDLRAPWIGFLVFPKWAATGVGIVGHVQTPTLFEGARRAEVEARAEELTLLEVKTLLDEAIRRRHETDIGVSPGDPPNRRRAADAT